MRSLFYFLAVALFLQSCSTHKHLAQNNIANHRIEFDFMNPAYPSVATIRPKQNVEIVLKNVNSSVYEVSINDSLITYPNAQPGQFNDIFKIPDLASLPKATPAASDSGAGQLPRGKTAKEVKAYKEAKAKQVGKEADLQNLLSEYDQLELNVTDFLNYARAADELKKLTSDCSTPLATLKQQADDYLATEISGLAPLKATFPLGIESFITTELEAQQKAVTDFTSKAESLKKDYQGILSAADANMHLEDYKKLENAVNEKVSVLNKALDNANELKKKLTQFQDAKVGNAIVEAYNKIMSSRTEITKLVPTGFGADEVSLKVNITKKGELNCAKTISSFPITLIVTRGVKIDFSTGLVLNIGRNGFFDQKYFADSVYRADNTLADSVQIRRSRNNNIVVPSLGVFMHIYSRWLSHVNIGGMVGASIGIDQHLYYHLGGNVLFGKSDRFILGFGASVAKATRLDGQYREDQVIKRQYAPASIPTEMPFRVGGFVSFSWNLNLIK